MRYYKWKKIVDENLKEKMLEFCEKKISIYTSNRKMNEWMNESELL